MGLPREINVLTNDEGNDLGKELSRLEFATYIAKLAGLYDWEIKTDSFEDMQNVALLGGFLPLSPHLNIMW